MSSKGSRDQGQTDDVPVEPETLSTAQESIPVPYLAGTRLVAIRWISLPFAVFAVQAKDEKPGKK